MSADILRTNRPMPKHGSINLYVHGNQKARKDGQPRTATSTLTQLLSCNDSVHKSQPLKRRSSIVQELCESRGGRPGLSVLTSLLVSVDVKIY